MAEEYGAQWYNTIKNMNRFSDYKPRNDIIKCMLIGSVFNVMLRFARGRVHYTQYVTNGIFGAIFGIGYSVLYISPKIDRKKAF